MKSSLFFSQQNMEMLQLLSMHTPSEYLWTFCNQINWVRFHSFHFFSMHFHVHAEHSNSNCIESNESGKTSKCEQFIRWMWAASWIIDGKIGARVVFHASHFNYGWMKKIENSLENIENRDLCELCIGWNGERWAMSNEQWHRKETMKKTHSTNNSAVQYKWHRKRATVCHFTYAKQMESNLWKYWLETPFNHLLLAFVRFKQNSTVYV